MSRVTLFQGDALEYLQRVPSKSIDLVLTDPPYFISRKSGFDRGSHFFLELLRRSRQASGQDFSLFIEEFFEEFRVFVIDIFDARFFEAAVFFLFDLNGYRIEVTDFGLRCCHDYCSFDLAALRFLRFSAYSAAYLSCLKVRKRMTRSSRRYWVSSMSISLPSPSNSISV